MGESVAELMGKSPVFMVGVILLFVSMIMKIQWIIYVSIVIIIIGLGLMYRR